MKKTLTVILVSAFALMLLVGYASQGESSSDGVSPGNAETKTNMNIMFVVAGSLGGGTNVDDVKQALDEYVAAHGGKISTFECKMDTSLYLPTLQQAAESDRYDLIVTGFSTMVEPTCTVAEMFPNQKFFLFDAAVNFEAGSYDNIISVQVLQNQGSFLAGALAALMTQSEDAEKSNDKKTVGFVGATESTSILDFMVGYIEGVKHVDTSVEVLYAFVGSQTDSALTQELVLAQYQSGADVIFCCSNVDLVAADIATTNDFYAICVDADEATNIAPSNRKTAEHILTSVVKDYKGMVAPILKAIGENTADWGKHSYISYAEGGVYLADNEFFQKLVPESVMARYKSIETSMLAGKISVNTAYGATAQEIASYKALAPAY
jgi:basic membrane protein A